MNLSIGGGVKSSRSKDSSDLGSFASKQLCSLEGSAFPSTNGRGQKINLSKAKVRFSGEGSDLFGVSKFAPSPTSATHDLCHAELVSGSDHHGVSKIPENTTVVASDIGQMPKQVRHDNKKKKVAFTLAEVLITLGIIGIVAAMTLPTLISNYQKQVYVNQLKKSVSSLSQGFTLMMGKDGVTELKDTEAFSKTHPLITVCSGGFINNDAICKNFREALYETFAGITINRENIKYKDLNGTEHNVTNDNVIHFPDGSYIFSFSFYLSRSGAFIGGTMKGSMGEFYIDINGSKNPNTVGRDIFQLQLGNVGGVYPAGSHATSEITNSSGDPDQAYWRTATNELYTCKSDGVSSGYGCAARVLEEDAMNY